MEINYKTYCLTFFLNAQMTPPFMKSSTLLFHQSKLVKVTQEVFFPNLANTFPVIHLNSYNYRVRTLKEVKT